MEKFPEMRTRIFIIGVLMLISLLVVLYVSRMNVFEIVKSSTENEIVRVHIELPRLKYIKDSDFETKFNSEIEEKIKKFVNEVKETAREDHDNGVQHVPYEAYVSVGVRYEGNDFLSFVVYYYQFTGGAHGITFFETYNIDIKNSKVLKLYDIIKKEAEDAIKLNILKQIEKNATDFFPDAPMIILKDDIFSREFTISKDGLIIMYPHYELAPYVLGMPEFVIPWNVIEKYLKYDILSFLK